MILLVDQRICIVTPPKTASDLLHRTFCQSPWHGLAIVGEHSEPGNIDKHYPGIPNEAAHFKKVLIVRHPLDRLVSLYHHYCRLRAFDGLSSPDFGCFVVLVAERSVAWMFHMTIGDLIGDFSPDVVIRVENLEDGLRNAGLEVADLPHWVNQSFRKEWWEYFRGTCALECAKEWAKADAERFGYDLDYSNA